MRQRRRFRLTFHYFNHTRDRTGGGLSYSITPQVHKILNFPGTCPLKCALKGNNNPPPLHNLTISLTCCKSYSTAGQWKSALTCYRIASEINNDLCNVTEQNEREFEPATNNVVVVCQLLELKVQPATYMSCNWSSQRTVLACLCSFLTFTY